MSARTVLLFKLSQPLISLFHLGVDLFTNLLRRIFIKLLDEFPSPGRGKGVSLLFGNIVVIRAGEQGDYSVYIPVIEPAVKHTGQAVSLIGTKHIQSILGDALLRLIVFVCGCGEDGRSLNSKRASPLVCLKGDQLNAVIAYPSEVRVLPCEAPFRQQWERMFF